MTERSVTVTGASKNDCLEALGEKVYGVKKGDIILHFRVGESGYEHKELPGFEVEVKTGKHLSRVFETLREAVAYIAELYKKQRPGAKK